MPILTADQKVALAARLAQPDVAGLADAAAADALNAPSVANPAPRASVPKPFQLADILACLTTSEANVRAIPYLPSVVADFEANAIDGCLKWVKLFVDTITITPAEASAIAAIVAATEPDPTWPPLVSWWRATFGDGPFTEMQPADVFDPSTRQYVPGTKPVTFAGYCTPAAVAEARQP